MFVDGRRCAARLVPRSLSGARPQSGFDILPMKVTMIRIKHHLIRRRMGDILSESIGCNTGIVEANSCSMLHPDSSAQRNPSPSLNRSLERQMSVLISPKSFICRYQAYLTKLCHRTPVGSSSTRTKTVTSAVSLSIVGRACPS